MGSRRVVWPAWGMIPPPRVQEDAGEELGRNLFRMVEVRWQL